MKIDNAIKNFIEKYDEKAIRSIDDLGSQLGRINRRDTIELFNINEAFENFNKWIQGYSMFQIEESVSPEISDIKESCANMIDGDSMFRKENMTYDKFTGFVKSYIEGVNETISNVEDVKRKMLESGNVDPTFIGAVDDFTDMFFDKMESSFTESMTKLLNASGYNTNKSLFGRRDGGIKKPVFL